MTATFNYEFKLNEKYRLSLSLNIDNLLDEDRVIYYGSSLRPPGGDVRNPSRVSGGGTHYFVDPRTFTLTAKFSF